MNGPFPTAQNTGESKRKSFISSFYLKGTLFNIIYSYCCTCTLLHAECRCKEINILEQKIELNRTQYLVRYERRREELIGMVLIPPWGGT